MLVQCMNLKKWKGIYK